MRKYNIFKFIVRKFEGKTTEELANIKSSLAMVYALCATNAILYYMYLTTSTPCPTDPESLKQFYEKNAEEIDMIKMTGLRKTEVTNDKIVKNTELLDDK
ncbi:hypothetical protein ANTPLA_LOCUS5944 [Anthophora plagiata]